MARPWTPETRRACARLWMQDIAPTVTVRDDNGQLYGVDFNFNAWGNKSHNEASRQFAKSLLAHLGIPRVSASISTEGGAIEVDGQGTLIAAESSILNDNRNPGQTRAQIAAELGRTLGIQNVFWVPGVKNLDVTDFHIDAVARFVRPGVALFANPREPGDASKEDAARIAAHREARRILAAAMDAHGKPLEILDVLEPRFDVAVKDKEARDRIMADKAAGYRAVFSYVNYLLMDGGVILSQFGDAEADAAALETVRKAFPEREVVTVNARALGLLGGCKHCVSHEVLLSEDRSIACSYISSEGNDFALYEDLSGHFARYSQPRTVVDFNIMHSARSRSRSGNYQVSFKRAMPYSCAMLSTTPRPSLDC